MSDLRERLAELVEGATNGQVRAADALTGSLSALGLDSLGHLRLIDAIDLEYGIETDLTDDGRRLDTVDDIAAFLTGHGVVA